MASEMTQAIYRLLTADKPVTPAGVCYLLRDDFSTAVSATEAERSLYWLRDNGFAVSTGDTGFGPGFLKAPGRG